MTELSKGYIDVLNNILDIYNNTYHRTIKMKPIDVKSSMRIDYGVENNNKGPKSKVGDHVRISKYKNIFVKVTLEIGQKKILLLKKSRILYSGHIVGTFNGKELPKNIKQNLEFKKK